MMQLRESSIKLRGQNVKFHNRCVRNLAKVSKHQQWKQHVKGEDLERRCGVQSGEYYLRARALRWVGHVVRMGNERLPRKLLFGWVANPRKTGRPSLTYGGRIERLVRKATVLLVDPNTRRLLTGRGKEGGRVAAVRAVGWVEVAKDREVWRTLVTAGRRNYSV